jgi:outer membrane receptor protein involved in Fe transport
LWIQPGPKQISSLEKLGGVQGEIEMSNRLPSTGFSSAGLFAAGVFAAMALTFVSPAFPQSTGTIQGTVADPAGAPIPNASVTVRDENTGGERMLTTDSAGLYSVPSLPVGTYRVEVKANGMAPTAATHLVLSVSTTVVQNFSLTVSSTSTVVEIASTAALIETASSSVGAVVNQTTVQEIPLNGRHFVDLSYLTPGTVTPPANGSLTAPLRGQGSFSFNSAGAREDSVNFMINGINLNDPSQNQVTFQPTINTVDEFKIDNQTFSAEYGRNSGSIVNIATRSGVNTWHGEAYEYLRNNDLDARNFSNPSILQKQAPFIRNQFGGDGGGALKKDKTFIYLSYEGLRQRQSVPISTPTLTAAQVAQAQASSDPIIKSLLALIPAANSGTNLFVGSAVAPVNISQGTANVSQILSEANRLNFYYAIQKDQRNEPPSTDANSFPGGGDQRNGTRQLLTVTDSWALSPTLVNEARAGFNRIHIIFDADNMQSATAFGIDSGVTAPIGIPQITVSGAFEFGGINGFPQGRGDNTDVVSDTLSWVHGNNTVKLGGEFRRANVDSFTYSPSTFSFASVSAFLADQANGFTANTSNRSSRIYDNALGLFLTDAWKATPTLTVTLGLRYDWYATPTEAENRFVIYDPASNTLQHVNQGGGPSIAYNQSAKNFEPRIGLAFDPFKTGKTVIRAGYAIMTDQPNFGLVTGLAANPPYAFPISYSPTTAVPFVTLGDAYADAAGSVSPVSVAHNYKDAYVNEYNLNIQQQFGSDFGMMVGYFGSKGTDLNIERNYNQLVNGAHPITALSASSPIDPGMPLGNILVYESDGNSSYNGLWVTANKRVTKGLQFSTAYTWSHSIDDNSRNQQGLVIQNSNNIEGDRGNSDFDTRQRIVVSGVYALPFAGNRLKEGWEISLIEQTQSGNPLNFHTSNAAFTGSANLRPNVTGIPVTGYSPATNGSAAAITYIQNPSVFVNQGNAFGDLGRNAITGPGFSNLDFSLAKNTKINEKFKLQAKVDAFDFLNQVNWANPGLTVGSSTLGLITTGTRFPAGDFGTSRQIQVSMKLLF